MSDKPEVKVEAPVKLQTFLEKEGIVLIPQPQFRLRDDGTFSVVVGFDAQYNKK